MFFKTECGFFLKPSVAEGQIIWTDSDLSFSSKNGLPIDELGEFLSGEICASFPLENSEKSIGFTGKVEDGAINSGKMLVPENLSTTPGFWQIIDQNGEIVWQRKSFKECEHIRNTVNVPVDHKFVFNTKSEVVQPDKFFKPFALGTKVQIFDGLVSKVEQCTDDLNSVTCLIEEVEEVLEQKGEAYSVWTAFVDKQFSGTSEY